MAGYTILNELGRGGMGVVYRARQEGLGREVALKTLLPTESADVNEERRFLREIRAMMKVQHPHVVRVFDSGQLDGRTFYAMELIAGTPLNVVMESGALPRPRALSIAWQLAQALSACHAAGLIHRDVKSENVMIGASDHATLMDFGLVRVEGGTVLTRTGEVIGTPTYLAPETLLGEPVGAPVDVYALGVLLMRMIAGRAPFHAQTLGTMLTEIVKQGPIPLETLCADVSGPLAELASRMVARDPAARPPIAEVEARLAELTGAPSAATPKSGTRIQSRTGKLSRSLSVTMPPAPPRRRTWVALTALAAAALLAGVTVWFALKDPASPPAGPSPTAAAPEPEPSPSPIPSPAPIAATTFHYPGEKSLGVRVFQDGAATFEARVERVSDGKVIWTARAGPERVTHFVARGLAPDTAYRVRLVSGTTSLAPREVRTREAGSLARQRARIHKSGDIAVMSEFSDYSAGAIDSEPELVPTLLARLAEAEKHNDITIAVFCARSLGYCGDPAGGPAIGRLLAREMPRRELDAVIASAARVVHPSVVEPVLRALERLEKWDAEDLAMLYWSDPERVSAFYRAVLDNAEKRRPDEVSKVAQACSKHRLDEVVPSLARAVNRHPAAAGHAIWALAAQRPEPLRRALSEILRFDLTERSPRSTPDFVFRHLVSRSGVDRELSATVAKLADAAGDRAPARFDSARALALCEPADAEPRLARLLADTAPAVRRAAALALGRLGTRAAADALIARLSVEQDGRGRLARALGMIRDARAAAPLLALVARPAAPVAKARPAAEIDRAEALWALGQLKEPRARAPAEAALGSRVDYVRYRAAEALGWLGGRESLPALTRAAARPGELALVADAARRATAWIEKGGPPRGPYLILDVAGDPLPTRRERPPGAPVPARVLGAWAKDAASALIAPDPPHREDEWPRLGVRASTEAVLWGDQAFMSSALWRGGQLVFEVWGESAEGIGFYTIWLDP